MGLKLVRCYQSFVRLDAQLHRERDLTPSQADVLFALGNTQGLTPKDIGERILMTKGTLTGVLDRMEAKRLLERIPSLDDGRSFNVTLTRKGVALFESVYPEHVAELQDRFASRLGDPELRRMRASLQKLRESLE